MVRLPCGDENHAIHARCMLVAVRSGGAQRGIQAPFGCSERGCGVRHLRREALEAAVQADPGLRDAAVALTGRPEEDDEGHRQGLYYALDQDSLGVSYPLECPRPTSKRSSSPSSKSSQMWHLLTLILSPTR